MLIISSLLVFFISVTVFCIFIRHSYLKNVAESICLLMAVLGLNLTCFAICLYYAEYGSGFYILNKYFFISQNLLSFFRMFRADVFAISNLLTAARLLFIVGFYCFGTIVIDRKLSFRRDFVLLIPVVLISMNISYIYIGLIRVFKQLSVSTSQAIMRFDLLSRLCMIPAIAVILIRLIGYYKSSHNSTLRRNVLLFFFGLILICVEYALILDLTPSTAANVYASSFLMTVMSQVIQNALAGYTFLYLAAVTLITASFLLVIVASINIMRWQNYNKVASITVNRSIPVTNVQNLIPFLHSFKNQLVSLTQFEKMITPENFSTAFPMICSITEEMSQTIDNLYGNSRDIKLNIVLSDVNVCIRQAVEAVRAAKNIKISLEPGNAPTLAMIDPEYIQHAMENIIYNAADACEERENGLVRVSVQKRRRFVEITVSDNGKGISKDNLKKIMEPFFSTKNRSHSWGMGLNHVNKIVNAHNGHVRINSEEGAGTTVSMLLPSGR